MPVRVGAVDAYGRHGVHRKAVYPPAEQDAEGGAKPGGEVRAFDLPMVDPQVEGALPSPAQRIRVYEHIRHSLFALNLRLFYLKFGDRCQTPP